MTRKSMREMTLAAALMLSIGVAPAAPGPRPGNRSPESDSKDNPQKQEVSKARVESQRAQIDAMANASLKRLEKERPESNDVRDRSYGYAVFDTTKVALGLSGGGGEGVAVSRTGDRTYMRMASVGAGLSAGAQNYQLILFFKDQAAFDHFVAEGWNAEATAAAGAGDKGAESSGTTARGITVFKLSDVGLMADLDLSGTRFWQADQLNP